jgi:hypothetical protein
MTRLLGQAAIAALLVAIIALAGCGGSGSSSSGTPPPPGSTGTIAGVAIRADATTLTLGGAQVTVLNSFGAQIATGTADANGNFSLPGVPVGTYTVRIDNPSGGGSQSVPGVVVNANGTSILTIAVLPQGNAAPIGLTLSPASAIIDLHGQIAFQTKVTTASGILAVTPTFILGPGLGLIDRNGNFTATEEGSGQLTAVIGSQSATASITVTAPRPPQITSFLVSPLTLTASGGPVYITVAANDGAGIRSIKAEIYRPGMTTIILPLTLNTQTTSTYNATFNAPANSNVPSSQGVQAPQTYSLRVVATDNNNRTTDSQFVTITVNGLVPPPGQ